jgi:hypothetical protein
MSNTIVLIESLPEHEREKIDLETRALAAEARLAKAVEALRWYADQKNYDAYAQIGVGNRARTALRDIEGGG